MKACDCAIFALQMDAAEGGSEKKMQYRSNFRSGRPIGWQNCTFAAITDRI
jgi:hypothetical protein